MYVSQLNLENFRNYRALEQALPPGLILLQGDNAQGKTNFLEALFVLATSRSPRTTRDGELIAWSTPRTEAAVTRIAATVEHAGGPTLLEVLMMPGAGNVRTAAEDVEAFVPAAPGVQKRLRVNGLPRRAIDLLGHLRVVLFRPEDMELVTGAPGMRRRALDILLSQMDQRYPRALQRYNRVLLQRNHLLRRIAERAASPAELEPWDSVLVKEGALILQQRTHAIERLSPLSAAAHQPLSGGREQLSLRYAGTVPTESERDLPGAFLARLQATQQRDVALGQTTAGPHRDDVELLIDGAPAAQYGSRGQQRTVALAWKLAEAQFLREATGEDPVVLLDDVFSELDAVRRACVLQVVQGYQQVLVTSTGAELSPTLLQPAQSFLVRQGALLAEEPG